MFFHRSVHNRAVQLAKEILPVEINVLPAPQRPHPWQIRPAWNKDLSLPGKGYWAAMLEPGMVNGFPAAVRMKFKDAPLATRLRVEKERAAENQEPITDDEDVFSFLDEQAQLRLAWRRIGTGAVGTPGVTNGELTMSFERVPEFFKRLGVKDASPNPLGYEAPDVDGVRYLAASDVVLNQPRVAVQSQVIVGQVVDGTITSVQPTYFVPPDRQPRVVSFSKFTPPAPVTLTAQNLFFAPFQEYPIDHLHLATVYAMSPLNPETDDITGDWAIYLRQNLHWNVAHSTRLADSIVVQPITLFTGLAGGIGDTLFNFILANNNDFAQAAANLITANNQTGRFHAI